MNRCVKQAACVLRRAGHFAQAGNVVLRPYQEVAIQAVVNSVRRRRGMRFVWIFPRQSGKDEALAILVQYLLTLFKNEGAEMVFFNPTFKPQTETSMRRLESRLSSNLLTLGKWGRRSGYIYQFNNAYCTYLSADPSAHVVSATANRLLVVNEAQDVGLLKYDKDIDPMAASSNATRLFAGTRWTESTLLEREYRLALEAEKVDHIRRVFFFHRRGGTQGGAGIRGTRGWGHCQAGPATPAGQDAVLLRIGGGSGGHVPARQAGAHARQPLRIDGAGGRQDLCVPDRRGGAG
jgi:hypothetical protein